ncbi:hypothetical protein HY374_04285 [Candidatus Berkelbacteria bacterium]|nr:hypothetical protein [Candidatus Berkelbacteria bacterium]
MTCPKCAGEMAKGKIKDAGYIFVQQQRWTEGNVVFGKEQVVDVWACSDCGYLESYLQNKQQTKSDKE